MKQHYRALKKNVSMLGKLLGEMIYQAESPAFFELVEQIRQLSKAAQLGDLFSRQKLIKCIHALSDEQLLKVARAFNHFLNLANTADQYYGISAHGEAMNNPELIAQLFHQLQQKGVTKTDIQHHLQQLSIELVLTAHPTEINRHTLINNSISMTHCLAQLDCDHLADYEKKSILNRLRQLIAQMWFTDEIRPQHPTPIEEAKWTRNVIQNSLWEGIPIFLRELNAQLQQTLNIALPVDYMPIRFTSWVGGDRDGNPNVTALITEQVLLQTRLQALRLYLKDIQVLVDELSMSVCTDKVIALLKNKHSKEPYRDLMREIRARLHLTKAYLNAKLVGKPGDLSADLILEDEQLWLPLYTCYESLVEHKMQLIADGPLLDTLRRIRCFGLQLLRLDIRQESEKHSYFFDEFTQQHNLGSYLSWDETQRCQFLLAQLNEPTVHFPENWQPSALSQEIFDTCKVIANSPKNSIVAYVISMSKAPSDLLAVHLLLKLAGNTHPISVTPLFETLQDLNDAPHIMASLLLTPWYKNQLSGAQMVMIGYSDSAKDAGTFAASWAQYQAQEKLIHLFEQAKIDLILFHGRGGTIGRGGAPAHAALFSQPPGSLKSGLRVTEQGEMIRFKFGLPQLSVASLIIYMSAILEANLTPAPEPKPEWRAVMDAMSDISYENYHQTVYQNQDFIQYFQSATPIQEITRLPVSSRPAKRSTNIGIQSLRAIPWTFAWMQNRLILSSWLGTGKALQAMIESGKEETLKQMRKHWPFFNTRIGLLEMVLKKIDLTISEYYEAKLVDPKMHSIGQTLRKELEHEIRLILQLNQEHEAELMADFPWISESVNIRNAYIAPLNYIQVELIDRSRQNKHENHARIDEAVLVSICGIAAGMRNTG